MNTDGLDMEARQRYALAHVRRMKRAALIAFCVWNDPNGCYTDHDMRVEFDTVSRCKDLRSIINGWILDGADISCATLREHGGANG